MLPAKIRTHLLQYCAGETSPAEFESWVFAADDLEQWIGHTAYVDLTSADYRGREAAGMREVCEGLVEEHHPGALTRYLVTKTLDSMLRAGADPLNGVPALVQLREQGCEFIPIIFLGIWSEVDSMGFDPLHLWESAAAADDRARWYRAQARTAAEELRDDLRRRYPDDV
jgi:hypothetical protein